VAVALALVASTMFCHTALAQDAKTSEAATISALIEQVKELQQHDRELQERIRALEAQQKPAEPAPAAPAASSTTAAPEPEPATESPVHVSAASELHNLGGIHWLGFGELDYKVLNQRTPELGTYGFVPGSAGNFYIGDFDLFLTAHLNDKTSVLSDIDFQEQDAQRFKIDVRRMLLKYDVNDHLRVSLGRYQTSIGYYNWAFRSASWLQTTADRPLVMEFATDGGFLPTQAVGISATGAIPSGWLRLNYVAEYGSSDTIRPDITGDGFFNDENNGNQLNFGLFLTPDKVPGLRIGGSFYHDQISDLVSDSSGGPATGIPVPPPSDRWNQTIVNGHVVYVGHGYEFLNEGFLIRHAPLQTGPTFNTSAFYSQFSRQYKRVRPYFRYQYANAAAGNLIFDDIGLRHGPSFGARYDFNSYLAFKAQIDHTLRRDLPAINGLHLQVSGTF